MTTPNILFRLCISLVLLVPITSAQNIVRSVEWFGNSYFSERELNESVTLKIGAPYDASVGESVKRTLTALYVREGFYTFTVDSIVTAADDDTTMRDVRLYLTEGKRTVVDAVELDGVRSFPAEQVTALMATKSGKPFIAEETESDIRAILRFYADNGYPFAAVTTDSIALHPSDESKLIVRLIVKEGSKVFINALRVEGNTATNAEVIVREARLKQEELFSDGKLDRIRRRIERLQLFTTVSQPELSVAATDSAGVLRGELTVRVKEGPQNSFDGIIGYVPASPSGGDGFFTGDVFVAFRNLFGTGRKAMVKWKRESALTQELELQYREPWMFSIPLNAGAAFYQRKQDSSYVKSRFDLRLDFAVTEELTVAGNLSAESVYPASTLQQFSVFESNTMSVGGEIIFDSRDNARNPTGGIRYSTSAQQGTKKITGPQQYLSLTSRRSSTIKKLSLDLEGYLSPIDRQVIMIGIHGRDISSSQMELSDLYQFGGTTTLRGYRENQFYASAIAWVNTEYRFLIGRLSSLYGFFDAGYYRRPADPLKGITSAENTLIGYGVGIRVETGLGIMNISYALGDGDSFSSGKIHVGLINEF